MYTITKLEKIKTKIKVWSNNTLLAIGNCVSDLLVSLKHIGIVDHVTEFVNISARTEKVFRSQVSANQTNHCPEHKLVCDLPRSDNPSDSSGSSSGVSSPRLARGKQNESSTASASYSARRERFGVNCPPQEGGSALIRNDHPTQKQLQNAFRNFIRETDRRAETQHDLVLQQHDLVLQQHDLVLQQHDLVLQQHDLVLKQHDLVLGTADIAFGLIGAISEVAGLHPDGLGVDAGRTLKRVENLLEPTTLALESSASE